MLTVNIQKKLPSFSLDAQFDVERNIVVLFGPSGAGKTTILNCIAGIDQPDSGHITLNGRHLFQTHAKPVPIAKRNIGYLFQDYALFPHMTVDKNIRYGLKNERLLHHLSALTGIDHLRPKYPQQISGGEKQRVALVRALVTQPETLLLDEPFSSLDHETRVECQDELLRLHSTWDIPILLVTHDAEEAGKLGDRILHIDQGQLVRK
ncbi:ATP-binding cassette domain-containing protein [Lentibacillus salinarum]|uniref:ATP-binding cassette domain-containing protein n=1 Tax=Lentibacillus salinarum TaxID=446820 RepID=A0ABW3ZX89_9BACI